MPSDRFFRLPEEKKAGIIRAAKEEFSNKPYENISISHIVKAAKISQGSFYTYFDGKEDLRQYLIGDIWIKLKRWIYETLEMCDGNICDAALYAVAKIIKVDNESQDFRLVKNTLLNAGWIKNEVAPGSMPCDEPMRKIREFAMECYERTDLSTVRVMDAEDFAGLVELLLMIVLKAATSYVVGDLESTKILMNAERQIQLLRA